MRRWARLVAATFMVHVALSLSGVSSSSDVLCFPWQAQLSKAVSPEPSQSLQVFPTGTICFYHGHPSWRVRQWTRPELTSFMPSRLHPLHSCSPCPRQLAYRHSTRHMSQHSPHVTETSDNSPSTHFGSGSSASH